MREMKDCGIAWIGEIPKDWEVVRYKNICSIQSGCPFDSSKFSNTEGFPLLRIRDITSGKIETYYTGEYSNEFVVQEGDLLVGMDGDFNVRLWKNDKALLNQRCCRIFENLGANREFIFYSLPMHLQEINDLAYATTVKHLSVTDIYGCKVPVPPISEQQSIANFLDEKCGEIDELVALQEKMIDELKAYKQSVITETVTKGLDKNVKMKESGVEWIGEIPEHWYTCKTLFLLSQPITDGPHETPNAVEEGIPFISAEAISSGEIDFSHKWGNVSESYYQECCKKYIPQIGDIYMTKSGASTGRTAIVKTNQRFTIWSPLAVFRAHPSKIMPVFLLYVLRSNYYLKQVETRWSYGTQQNIGMRMLEKLLIAVPPLSEQHSIATYLDTKCSEIDSLISIKQKKIEELKDYKKSLIYEYVTGKKQVI